MQHKIYGLIGYPLKHSFSQSYFEQKFAAEGIEDAVYRNFPMEYIDELTVLMDKEPNLRGLNVTLPYKEKVLWFMTKISPIAKAVGAANVVKFEENERGVWCPTAYNTDVVGFEKSFLKHKTEHLQSALILGTGGSAKAVAYVLKQLGIAYQFVSRRPQKDMLSYENLDRKTIENNLLIINTTPLGMFPKVDACPPIDYAAVGKDHFLFDLIYNPEETLFMKKGKQQGASVQNGYEMLCYQAEESWKIWNEG